MSRSVLFGKLNTTLYKALENAFVFCKLRENSYVELVHWLHTLLQTEKTDIFCLINRFGLDEGKLRRDLLAAVEKLPVGATAVIDFSEHIETAVEKAWAISSLEFGADKIRSAHLIYTLLQNKPLQSILANISAEFLKIKPEVLSEEMASVTAGSEENREAVGTAAAEGQAGSSTDSALAKYGSNLTEKAKNGEIDPLTGRDAEIRQIIDILMRRRQNNPILTGEAGVGKTAVVEALALRLAAGEVPPALKDVQLILLDIGLLKAGASVSGEFESRLRAVMDEVESSPIPIVLFIDEIHTLIGAGGAAGTGDAANLLKPALARGKLRTIGATTWAEYKKYFEKDPALTRRFQVVQIEEPSEEKAVNMLRALNSSLEKHHKVIILDEAIQAAVKLSHRYIPARQLPDKAVGLIDTACARVAVSQHAVPGSIEYLHKKQEALLLEQSNLAREQKLSFDCEERQAAITKELDEVAHQLEDLEKRWEKETALVEELLTVRAQIMQPEEELSAAEQKKVEARQKALVDELKALQGIQPLVMPLVDARTIADVVADWTGIPVGKMMKDEVEAVLHLADTLNKRIIGQRHGLEAIARRVQTSRANLDNPNKPIGVFMLAGPSGVGKTETALALADTLYGGEHNVITINMSEYQESHTVSTLKGAPPGYVGYGEGGVLTEAVRRKPYSVILLDEVEKAHPDVHEIFFQVFDKGWMEDGEGRYIDFKNTIIILTTNVGTDLIMDMCDDPEMLPTPEGLAKALRAPMLKVFPAALLGRMQVIPYYPLLDDMLAKIVELQLGRIVSRIKSNHNIDLTYTPDVLKLITSRCTEVESGGRMIDAILTNTVLPQISRALLTGATQGKQIATVHISVADNDFSYEYQMKKEVKAKRPAKRKKPAAAGQK
ncbi:MAG: type VI secretion system ATPase TssH [Neisseria sp.]|uniref:type VI secretion system ATPase TssH n=1 Tax=Neisseria sp. TaxID=192066 RepID=UPI0026DB337C|nr:type VI secretion system ATPase TssH [Neisseria sp.]MDO4640970.1 type VI secretion system ATPase TssH [Neisseria sp.]